MQERGKNAGLFLAYPIIWALSVAVFWLFMGGADAMGYALIFVWLLNPAGIFAVSFLIGRRGKRRAWLWTAPVAFGVLYMLLPYVTFSLANTLTSGNVHTPDMETALFGVLVSTVGLCLGVLAHRLARKRSARMPNDVY